MKIIHEEEKFIIVEKSAGQLVLPIPKSDEKTLRDELLEKYSELAKFDPERAGIVHRLDRETSGLLLVAKTSIALKFFQGEFGARRVKKEYLALVCGTVKKDKDRIDLPLGRSPSGKIVPHPIRKKEREAVTEYVVLERFKDFTLVQVRPETGRQHQIRAHFAAIGHPIFGDKIYGKNSGERLFLHASKLEFFDPDAKWRVFESHLPSDLAQLLTKLKNDSD